MQASERMHEVNGMALQSVQGLPWWCDVPPSLIATPAMKPVCTEEEHSNEVARISAPLQPTGFVHSSSHRAPSPVLTQALTEVKNTQLKSSGMPSSSGFEENRHLLLTTGLGMAQSHGDYGPPLTPLELSQSMVQAAYPYADPYFGGMVAAYGAHAMIPPHMLGIQQGRMPLPSEITEEEPVYVNAKQYNGILRRRQCRARAESENKLVKSRKPYLHESRHLHAKRRARGCGGRFLNKKEKDSAKTNVSGNEQSFQGNTFSNLNDSYMHKSSTTMRSQDYGTMQGLSGHLVGMGQSLGGGSGHFSEMRVQSDHPIMSSGVSWDLKACKISGECLY